jgi:DNA polymerase-3 subunit gamma/tau
VPRSYNELVTLAGEKRDLLVKHALEADLRPIAFDVGRIEVALTPNADPGIIATLSTRLKAWTGRNWMVTVSREAPVAPTIREQQRERDEATKAQAHDDPLVRAILETWPGAKVQVTLREEQVPVEAYEGTIRDEEEDDE